MKLQSTSLAIMAFSVIAAVSSQGAVLITQYYEGPSTNKWIEITNTGTTSVNLATLNYKLSIYTNAAAENYKTVECSFTNVEPDRNPGQRCKFLVRKYEQHHA